MQTERLTGNSNPFLYPIVFGALLLIKAITKHYLHNPGWLQALCALGLGIACYPLRQQPLKNLFVYTLLVVALSLGYAYPDAVWEVARQVFSRI